LNVKVRTLESNISLLNKMETFEQERYNKWKVEHDKTIAYVLKLYDKFEGNRKRIMSKKCDLCLTVLEHPHEVTDDSENPHIDRLQELKEEANPYSTGVKDFSNDISEKTKELSAVKSDNEALTNTMNDLETLEDITAAFRSTLIKNTVYDIENTTNDILLNHFDAEIQVEFNGTDNDKLEINIKKDGNAASFTQLSKGQRQLLKLSFGVAVMKSISNHKGVHFSQLFFDEFADGLDESMKIKSFSLLQELSLSHESVFAIDHSEGLKAMFDNKYSVTLVNGNSEICQN
jgi:hypothetical protein